MKQRNQTLRLILSIFIPYSRQFFIILTLSVYVLACFSGVTESSPLWTQHFWDNGHCFTDFLRVNSSLIKIKFLVSVVKYIFIRVVLHCQKMKWLYSISCLLVCVSLGNSICLIAYKYLNACPNMGVLNMNHEKNKLYQKAALQPLITTSVFASAGAFLSHKHWHLCWK